MILLEIEKKIKPLSKTEKLQLVEDVIRMVREEERLDVSDFIQPGVEYPIFTPMIADSDDDFKAAYQLQQLLENS